MSKAARRAEAQLLTDKINNSKMPEAEKTRLLKLVNAIENAPRRQDPAPERQSYEHTLVSSWRSVAKKRAVRFLARALDVFVIALMAIFIAFLIFLFFKYAPFAYDPDCPPQAQRYC